MATPAHLSAHEAAWRSEYRKHRYLEHAEPAEIQERVRDILVNCYTSGRDGRLYQRPDCAKWAELLSHVLEEATLRNLKLLQPTPRRCPNAPRASTLWDGLRLNHGTYLLKFGMASHMNALCEHGTLRVAPAKTYMDATFNEAIRDNEHEFTQESLGATVQSPPNRDYSLPREQWISVPVIGTLKQTAEYQADYYLSSFSMGYEYRLFDDFGYDSCLVVRDPRRFVNSLMACGAKTLPGWHCSFAPVDYRDPFHPTPKKDVLFSKHFKFTYEQEFRVIWEPPSGPGQIDPVFFDMGPLTDYCDLLVL
jgi:hypothetical protein